MIREQPAPGASVADNLTLFHGVWHDVVTAYEPDGRLMAVDTHGGTPGPTPYEQLVYLDFDGERLIQTNVVLRGRDPHVRTFEGRIVEGVLVFDTTGLEAPETIGVSGGPGVLVFLPRRLVPDQVGHFHDPDYIRHLGGDQRTRTTTLYREGRIVRLLSVAGTRISTDPTVRVAQDPRGSHGPVHERITLPRDHFAEETS